MFQLNISTPRGLCRVCIKIEWSITIWTSAILNFNNWWLHFQKIHSGYLLCTLTLFRKKWGGKFASKLWGITFSNKWLIVVRPLVWATPYTHYYCTLSSNLQSTLQKFGHMQLERSKWLDWVQSTTDVNTRKYSYSELMR